MDRVQPSTENLRIQQSSFTKNQVCHIASTPQLPPPIVQIDPAMIQLVIQNILQNQRVENPKLLGNEVSSLFQKAQNESSPTTEQAQKGDKEVTEEKKKEEIVGAAL